MKTVIAVLVSFLLVFHAWSEEGDFTLEPLALIRYPVIGENLKSNLVVYERIATQQTYPHHLMLGEGQYSVSGSSAQGSYDYFAVYLSNNSQRGRILRLSPLETSVWGVLTRRVEDGRSKTSILLTDVSENITFSVDLYQIGNLSDPYDYTLDDRGFITEVWFEGELFLDGEVIFISLRYSGTPRYPTIALTWGENATNDYVGYEKDDFSLSTLSTDPPLVQIPEILKIEFIPASSPLDPDVVLLYISGEKNTYDIESISDLRLRKWNRTEAIFIKFEGIDDKVVQVLGLIARGGKSFFRARIPR